jgi:hypothetical protein
VYLKTSSSEWSIGAIDLNEIGSYDILLPTAGMGLPEVLHVDVMLSPASDLSCYISVVIWKPLMTNRISAPVRVVNSTHLSFSMMQNMNHKHKKLSITKVFKGGNLKGQSEEIADQFRQHIGPNSSCPLGWIDPCADSMRVANMLLISAEDDSLGFPAAIEINMVDVGSSYDLTSKTTGDCIHLTVVNERDGKVLKIHSAAPLPRSEERSSDTVAYTASMKTLSVSIIAERPIRREVLALTMQNLYAEYTATSESLTYLFKVADFR